jgi:AcrR family transcriptional regulator
MLLEYKLELAFAAWVRKTAQVAKPKSSKALRKQPAQERSRATVDALLQATAYILIERGWDGLSTNAIAKRAGVNIASLYQYFADKQAIVAELERRHIAETRQKIAEVFMAHRGESMAARARTLVEAGIAAHRVSPELHRVFTEELPRGRHRAKKQPFVIAAALAELSELGLPHPDLAAWMVATVSHAVVHEGIVERRADIDSGALSDELVWLLLRYLKRPRATAGAGARKFTAR